MIEHVRLRNFRCFAAVDVGLRPLTALIGQNDSGKSSFLSALARYSPGSRHITPLDQRRLKAMPDLLIQCRTSDGVLNLTPSECVWAGASASNARELDALAHVSLFTLPSTGVALSGPGQPDNAGIQRLSFDGGGLPALLDRFLRRDRARFDRYVTALKGYVPGLDDVRIETPAAQDRSVILVIDGGLELPFEQISVGVRMIAFFVALAFHPQPPSLVLIEEPENGVHPQRLKTIVDLFRDMTTGKHGGAPAQVVFTTHSPYALDAINLETDQVLVFQRQPDGTRTVEPVDRDRLKVFLDEFMLGEVWFNEQEAGLVKPRE